MDERHASRVLTINSGSSSIKFAIYEIGKREAPIVSGTASGIGLSSGLLRFRNGEGNLLVERKVLLEDHHSALHHIIEWLDQKASLRSRIDAIGHRLVHGGSNHILPQLVTPELLTELQKLVPFAPDHLPHEISAIQELRKSYPDLAQVACFDTAFHYTMPEVAKLYALPEEVRRHGVMRYGFHGLSYEYIVSELQRIRPEHGSGGKVVIAHLGNGASMAAIKAAKSMDTTMGFTPAGGLVMSTRSGDLDPGVCVYLLKEKNMDALTLNRVVNKEAGLYGISGTSSDMQELLDSEKNDPRAAQAVALFCYQARKFLGALAAVLNGLDTLVFTGGIGEHAAPVRKRICENMDFLGIRLDPERNKAGADIISADNSPVTVRVMKTNEELMIARHTRDVLLKASTKIEALNPNPDKPEPKRLLSRSTRRPQS